MPENKEIPNQNTLFPVPGNNEDISLWTYCSSDGETHTSACTAGISLILAGRRRATLTAGKPPSVPKCRLGTASR